MIRDLDYVVDQVMVDLEEADTTNRLKYKQWAIWILTNDLNYKFTEIVNVELLKMNHLKVIDMPIGMIDYTIIGYCCAGKIITLGLNKKLCLPRKIDECGDLLRCISNANTPGFTGFPDGWEKYPFVGYFRNGQYVGELYGLGGGFARAYYKMDWKKRQIVFEGEVPRGEIYLEYVSNGIEMDGSIPVDMKFLMALRQYIHWQRVEHAQGVSLGEKERKERQYYIELHKLVDMKDTFTLSEYKDMVLRRMKLVPQRP